MQIKFSRNKNKALYIQLYEAISEDIITGRLPYGVRLPARRVLAEQLDISQNTVEGAYKMLADTGYITAVPRQGYVVSFKSLAYKGNSLWEDPAPELVVFTPNSIDISRINRATFGKILKDISYNDGIDIFSFGAKNGEFELRNTLSKYLYSFRNVKCSPDRIIIGAGAEYLLASFTAIFSPDTALIMENPCYTRFYRVLCSYNNLVEVLPYNPGQFNFDALYASKGNILFIDPDARFPRGTCMSREERLQLLNWANAREGRYIIENCYDSEILWETGETLYSMDNNNKVIYMGSLARSLCPAFKTSYMALPPEVLARWKQFHTYYYALTSKTEQYALSDFINKGYFTKHYRTMRKVYQDRSNYLASCLTDAFGNDIRVLSSSASTYLTAEFQQNTEKVIELARRNGVKLPSLNSFNPFYKSNKALYQNDDHLIFGFGELNNEKIRLGVTLLKDVLS